MKTLDAIILKRAIGMVVSDYEQIKSYRKLQKALENGQGNRPASNYCELYQLYEYDTVKNVLDEIEANEVGLREFLNEAESVKNTPIKNDLVHNVLKVIDVNARDVNKKTIEFLTQYYCTYNDSMENCAEDLLDIVSAAEPDAMSQSKSKIVQQEIKHLAKLAEHYDAGYVRFTVI